MPFLQWIKFFVCFLPSMILMMLTLYLHNQNQVQCPRTFFKYQLSFCECDLIEREFHKEQRTPEWELNELCNTRYATESVLYLDTNILFSVNLPSNNYEGNTELQAMLIAGGFSSSKDGERYNTVNVEVIAPQGALSCTLPDLPVDRMLTTLDSGLICGGMGSDYVTAANTCQNLTSSGWATSHQLQYMRERASILTLGLW